MLRVFKPLALLALPRTGSTWFGNCVFGKERRGDRGWEFFNPNVNSKFYAIWGGNRYWWKLFESLTDEQASLVYKHWQISGFDSVKECWGLGKIDFFAKHFHCFALLRETELTFPGVSEEKINQFSYRAYYASLVYHKYHLDDYRRPIDFLYKYANSMYEKICGTHIITSKILTDRCKEFGIPVFNYRELVSLDKEGLQEYLTSLPICSKDVAEIIVATRRPRLSTEKFEKLGVSKFCSDLKSQFG